MKFTLMFLIAFVGAFSNAMFAVGQRKATDIQNGLAFVCVCFLVSLLATYLFSYMTGPTPQYLSMIKRNYGWILLSGLGTAVLNVCLYLLFTRYGVSSYALFAIIGIALTALIGVFVFSEEFNFYYGLSLFFGIIAVVCFAIAKSKG